VAIPGESKSVPETRPNEEQKKDSDSFSLEQIGQLLTEYNTTRWNSSFWKDMMRLYGSRGMIGEIRTPEDWRHFPRDVPVRIVFFRDSDGPVLRWASEDKQLNQQIMAVREKLYLATVENRHFDTRRYERQLKELQKDIITHEELATYIPKANSDLRTGYITLKVNDELIVHAKGDHIFHL
jgi:hypothetical protein